MASTTSRLLRLLPGLLLTVALRMPVLAQEASISGFVTDSTSGEALELVNVSISRSGAIEAGTVSGQDGLYFLPDLPAGRYALQASYVGYTTYRDTISLRAGERYALNIALAPTTESMEAVVVEGEQEGGMARITAGQQTVRPADIALVPSPSISGDLAAYLTTIPGIVSTGDRGGQLFIRGGEPSGNLVQLDGMVLYQPFHLFGFFSAFPTEVLSRADVYAGGFSSRFGERTSSVIDAWTRNGNNQRFGGEVALSPYVSTAVLEGPIVKSRLSFLASARRSTLQEGAEHLVRQPLPFQFGDFLGKISGRLSGSDRLSVTGITSWDRGAISEDATSLGREEISWRNSALGLRYMFIPRILNSAAELQVSHTRLDADQGPYGDPLRSTNLRNLKFSFEATIFAENTEVDGGMVVQFTRLSNALGEWFQNVERTKAELNSFALYLDPRVHLGNGLMIQPSVRMQFYNISINPSLEPRIRAVWEQGIHQFSGAAGLYKQELIGLNDRRDAASVFTAWINIPGRYDKLQRLPSNSEVTEEILRNRVQTAFHAILGYRISPTRAVDVSVETYYRTMDNLFINEWTAFPHFITRLARATGYSGGADARIEYRRARFYGFVSYGLATTRYASRQPHVKAWYGTDLLRFRPGHDRRHRLNVLGSLTLGGFEVNARWDLGSGLPYSRPQGFDGYVLMNDLLEPGQILASPRVLYNRPYDAVLPAYHRLDLSLTRTFDLGAADLALQASVINSYDRSNVFYVDVFTGARVNQVPLVPSMSLKVSY